jgi:hypothetical protein
MLVSSFYVSHKSNEVVSNIEASNNTSVILAIEALGLFKEGRTNEFITLTESKEFDPKLRSWFSILIKQNKIHSTNKVEDLLLTYSSEWIIDAANKTSPVEFYTPDEKKLAKRLKEIRLKYDCHLSDKDADDLLTLQISQILQGQKKLPEYASCGMSVDSLPLSKGYHIFVNAHHRMPHDGAEFITYCSQQNLDLSKYSKLTVSRESDKVVMFTWQEIREGIIFFKQLELDL